MALGLSWWSTIPVVPHSSASTAPSRADARSMSRSRAASSRHQICSRISPKFGRHLRRRRHAAGERRVEVVVRAHEAGSDRTHRPSIHHRSHRRNRLCRRALAAPPARLGACCVSPDAPTATDASPPAAAPLTVATATTTRRRRSLQPRRRRRRHRPPRHRRRHQPRTPRRPRRRQRPVGRTDAGDGRLTLAFTGDALWHSPLWRQADRQLRRHQRRRRGHGLHADARPPATGRRRRRRRRVPPRDADRPRRQVHDVPAVRRATRGRHGDRQRRVRPLLDGEQPHAPTAAPPASTAPSASSKRTASVSRGWPAHPPRSPRRCSSPTGSGSPTSPTRSATTASSSPPARSGDRR